MRPAAVLPYEPNYAGHREAEERHAETKRWLLERERHFAMKDLRRSRQPERDQEQPQSRKPD